MPCPAKANDRADCGSSRAKGACAGAPPPCSATLSSLGLNARSPASVRALVRGGCLRLAGPQEG
eukprot:10455512-Alexandrium_andersonii.AAC.1